MADDQFDLLTKAFSARPSRRHFFKLLVGSAAGSTLAVLGFAHAYAADAGVGGRTKPGGAGHGCTSGSQCKSGVCCNGHCCASGMCCQRGEYCASAGDCV